MPHDDLLAPEVIADPYTYFNTLRDQHPVYWNPRWNGWILTRYDDVVTGFTDKRFSADRITPYVQRQPAEVQKSMALVFDILTNWMVFNDPPSHTRLRGLVNKAFTPKVVRDIEPRIQHIVDGLLNDLHGSVELVKDFAYPLPIIVISEMLGISPDDRDRIKRWSDDIMVLVFGAVGVDDRHERARQGIEEFVDYLRHIIEARRNNPSDDLITALLHAHEKEDILTEDEVLATCLLLIFGGHETTTNLISNGTLALLQHNEQMTHLKDDPTLIERAVEEFLRFDGPSKTAIRQVKEPIAIDDHEMQPGQRVLLVQASANRDPAQFTAPDTLDITRQKNNHIGFGYGMHYCIGAPLARAEARIAIGSLVEQYPAMQLETSDLAWQTTILSRSLLALPVKVS